MSRALRVIALALALAATPACASLPIANPIAAAQTLDHKAYALIGAYALTLEQATALVRNPATPQPIKGALANAEAAATPAIELVKIAAAARQRAAADAQTREAALSRAIEDAAAPVAAFSALIGRTAR